MIKVLPLITSLITSLPVKVLKKDIEEKAKEVELRQKLEDDKKKQGGSGLRKYLNLLLGSNFFLKRN